MPEPRRNLSSFLDDLERRGEGPAFALRTPYRRFTWSGTQVRRAALGLAGRLREGGLVPGDRVLLSGPSCPEWAAALLGIVAAGGIAVPLDEVSPPEFGRRVGAKVAARAAILPAARARELAGVAPRTETLESLRMLAAGSGPLPAPHQAAPGDTAEIVFTSGTTAEPKGVELSHGNLLASLEGIEAGFRARQWYLRPLLPLRLLCLVPLSHLFGQSVGIFVPIALRSVGIYSSTLQPARLLGEIRREGPIVVIAVPRTLAGLADAARRELGRRGRAGRFEKGFERARGRGLARRVLATRDIRRILGWRTLAFVSGGAALDRELEEFWTRCGIFVIQGYGMTEAAPIIAVHNPLDGVAGTIGHAAGAQEIRLAEDGEILVRGPNIMKGYYGDPAATGEVLRDGWLHTGDIGELDAGGRLFFRGRKKDVIVTADGMNIHPSDVEGVLCSVPGVGGAVVFGLPGPAGEEIHAAVLAAGLPPDPEAVRQAANGRLLGHQKLKGVTVWGEADFPRTRIGKVKRGEVAAVALALRAGAGPGSTGDRGSAAVAPGAGGPVASAIARLRGAGLAAGPAIKPGARLAEDLGLSSLEMVELIGLLEEEHDVALDDRQVGSSLTVGELESLVTGGGEEAVRVRMPRWSRTAPFCWLRALLQPVVVRPLYWPFVRFEFRGGERLRGYRGPCIVVANHQSLMDVPAILFALPRPLRGLLAPAMAIEVLPEHFEPEGKPLARRIRSALLYNLVVLFFNAYPLPQSRGFRPSLEYTGELIDLGLSPLIFPEGERTPDGPIHPFKRGIGLLAIETRVPIVPVLLEGLYEIMDREASWPGKGRARVTVGEPFDPLAGGMTDPDAIAARIEASVRNLKG